MEDQVFIERANCWNIYLLFHISNGSRERDVLVSSRQNYHRELFENYKKNLSYEDKNSLEVLGGGLIRVDEEHKKIIAYCQSKDYGECPKQKVEELLKKYYSDYSIETLVKE